MTDARPRVGLLPLYLKLYDDTTPEARETFLPFMTAVEEGFIQRGIAVRRSEVCRLRSEVDSAITEFEAGDVDCIVSLHLAYSPSLEAVDALANTSRPLLMLDTTMDAQFGFDTQPERIMFNHGIHGVMDLASVLRRRGRHFEIVAGHVDDPGLLDRAAATVRAAFAARCFHKSRILSVGTAFDGMGDFAVPHPVLRERFGIEVDTRTTEMLEASVRKVDQKDIDDELDRDRTAYACDLPADVHSRSVRVGLGLRREVNEGGFSAFTMNFLAFNSDREPVDTVPFLEASKAMASGLGYAGEGDVLTANLVGALCRAFGRVSFTEIFCPDWQGNTLFLSHMGEFNPRVAAEQPRLIEKPFPFTAARNPAILVCAPQPGPAVFVNLAPGPSETFDLIAAPVRVQADSSSEAMRDCVRAWIRPESGDISAFLESYSRLGGTHHSALVLGVSPRDIAAFGGFLGIPCHVLE